MIRVHVSRAMLLLAVVAPALSAQRRLTATRDLVIDGTTHDIAPVEFLQVATDGTIAMVSYQDMVFRFFTATGRDAGRFGRHGAGPAEFTQPRWFGWSGTSLWVADPSLNRLTWIGPDRKLQRSMPLPMELRPPAGREREPALSTGVPMVIGVFPGGDLALLFEQVASTTPAWLPLTSAQANLTLFQVDTAFRFRRAGGTLTLAPREPECAGRDVVEWLCKHAVEAGLGMPYFARVERAPSGAERQFRLLAYDLARGGIAVDRLIPYDAIPFPSGARDSLRRAARNPSLRVPEAYRPVAALRVGADGTFWMRRDGPSRSTARWLVLDRRGTALGEATLPASVTLHQVSRTTVWGTAADDDGVESIVRYRIH